MSNRTKHRRTKESRLLNFLMTRSGVPAAAARLPAALEPFSPNRAMRRRAK